MTTRDYPHIDTWNFLHIEGFCTLNTDYGLKYSKVIYLMKKNENGDFDFIPEPNDKYDPSAVPDDYPETCTRHITVECIRCPHFAYTESDYKWSSKEWDNDISNDEKD